MGMMKDELSQEDYYRQFTHNVKMWVYSYYEDFLALNWLNRQGFRIYLTGMDLFLAGMGLMTLDPSVTVIVDRLSEGSGTRADLLKTFQHISKLPYGQFRYKTDNIQVHAKTLGGAFAVIKEWGKRGRSFSDLPDIALLNVHAAAMDLCPYEFVPFIQDESAPFPFIGLEPKHRFIPRDEFYQAYKTKTIALYGDQEFFSNNQLAFMDQVVKRLKPLKWKVHPKLKKMLKQLDPSEKDSGEPEKTTPQEWQTY